MKVSVIMPCHRIEDMPKALDIFLSQDYKGEKELIVIAHNIDFDMGDYPLVKSISIKSEYITIGELRNIGCHAASGKIILHQDSDDLYAPDWISSSVDSLVSSKADITGLNSAYFISCDKEAWLYRFNGRMPYAIGATLCYWRYVWERKPFKAISEGEDTEFISNNGRIVPHGYIYGFRAVIHGNNTASHKQLNSECFTKMNFADIDWTEC